MGHEGTPKGFYDDVPGKLAEGWKKLSIEDQQTIADALAEITGDGGDVCRYIQDEHSDRFQGHLRTYLRAKSDPAEEKTGLKEEAARAMNEILAKTDQ